MSRGMNQLRRRPGLRLAPFLALCTIIFAASAAQAAIAYRTRRAVPPPNTVTMAGTTPNLVRQLLIAQQKGYGVAQNLRRVTRGRNPWRIRTETAQTELGTLAYKLRNAGVATVSLTGADGELLGHTLLYRA